MKKNRYHSDYDFEEEYQKQIENMEQFEIDQLMKKNPGIIYQTKTTKAGDQIEVDIYPAFRNRKDVPRSKTKKISSTAQKNLNDKKSKRYLNNLLNANFGKGDIWATFTYDKEHIPGTEEESQKCFRNFIRRINRKRAKEGKQNIKYVCVTEYKNVEGEDIRCHHHVVMEGDIDRDLIESFWKYGNRNQTRRIDPDPDTGISGIAHYMTKQNKDPKRRKGSKRWTASRNLKKPVVTKSYTKFGRRTAQHMAVNREYLEKRILKNYPKCKLLEATAYTNEINGGFYIYARMVRN